MASSAGPTSTEAVQERAALRTAIKREFQKQASNPHRHGSGEGGYLFDPAIQRFMSLKVTRFEFFKANPRTSLLGSAVVATLFGYCWWLKTDRESFEHKCRTGQVSYASREFKFA
ncbi:hypothetical protein Pmani_022085 [Petrolisthes manimaculis]|uniref:NADH dehydrogenase [ubiquinone] 1 beta subcomplex subunit 4 n=1 Tax=Petrolisthes manimaculis TaxID=1843537 RepID=A0AAE1TXV7_9EUCA|nr:hypothetical protein Pmani_025197 [Petrolisthes manimaculis]KAK4306069.1 hypothetical protein Pmani_022085 [Petrolisthes manimaculis]